MKINYYHQIRGFYSKVFEGIEGMRPVHVSLYMFLLNQNNRHNWKEWFKCPFDTAMEGALINSPKTYYAALQDLENFGFIKWKKGINLHKAPHIHIINLGEVEDIVPYPEEIKEESTPVEITSLTTRLATILTTNLSITQCITLLTNLCTTLSSTLSSNRDIHITDNIKQETDNRETKTLFAQIGEKFGLGVRAMVVDVLEQPEEEKEKKVAPKKERSPAMNYHLMLFENCNHGFSEEFEGLWITWMEYLTEIKKPYSNQMSMQTAIDCLAPFGEEVARLAITTAIKNEWKSLYPEKVHEELTRNKAKNGTGGTGIDLSRIYSKVQRSNSE